MPVVDQRFSWIGAALLWLCLVASCRPAPDPVAPLNARIQQQEQTINGLKAVLQATEQSRDDWQAKAAAFQADLADCTDEREAEPAPAKPKPRRPRVHPGNGYRWFPAESDYTLPPEDPTFHQGVNPGVEIGAQMGGVR